MEWAEDKLRRALVDAERKSKEQAVTDARLRAVLFPANGDDVTPGCDQPFRIGDEVEVAKRELAVLGWKEDDPDFPTVLGDRHSLYLYDKITGAWEEQRVGAVRNRVMKYSGMPVQREGRNAKGEPYQPSRSRFRIGSQPVSPT